MHLLCVSNVALRVRQAWLEWGGECSCCAACLQLFVSPASIALMRTQTVVVAPEAWDAWLAALTQRNHWDYRGSHIVWRDYGSQTDGELIGTVADFLQLVRERGWLRTRE